MTHPDLVVVTGAFSYTGSYVARRLVGQGVRVRTLTRRSDQPNPFGDLVEAAPMDFSDPDGPRLLTLVSFLRPQASRYRYRKALVR